MEKLSAIFLFAVCLSVQGEVIKTEFPQVSCPLLFCIRPENCTQLKTTYLDINNRKCIGCPVCADSTDTKREIIQPTDIAALMPCPIVDCAFPGVCTHSKVSYFEINGHKCPGCPICTDTLLGKRHFPDKKEAVFECPFIDCANPGPCTGGKLEYNYMMWNGRRCAACSRCVGGETEIQLQPIKRNVIPIDLVHLRPCPIVDCAFTIGCAVVNHTTFEWNGHKCQGCPVCADKLIPREILPGNVIHLNMCPMVMCANPGPCKQPYKVSTTMWMGKECPGCSYCPDKTQQKRDVISHPRPALCPMVKCRDPGQCDHAYNMTYAEFNGVKCPMCPFCDTKTQDDQRRDVLNPGVGIVLNICPIPMCMNPGPCDHPYSTSYMTVGEKKCPMCSYCAKNGTLEAVPVRSTFTCPHLPCPNLIDCKMTKPTSYKFEGHTCNGCPVCVDSS